jgi:hypothetical protein
MSWFDRLKGAFVVLASVLVAAVVVSPVAQGAPQLPHFTDVTTSAGIEVAGLGNAVAWVDVDGDGRPDLFATNSDFNARAYLYHNNGDGTFTDVTGPSGLGGLSIRSVAWADYDNDGHPDFAATTYAFNGRTKLFHNNGDGTFTDVSVPSGMLTASTPWRVTWADYDRDGFVDLYQADFGRDLLYHNDGDGTFTEVAQQAGVTNSQSSTDGAWGDFDSDGWPDLFVADEGPDHLYRNDGDRTFTDVTLQAGVSDAASSEAACWGDPNDDLRPDLYVVDIEAAHNHLYQNDGDGTFTDVTQQSGTGDVGDGRTCDWIDPNLDGRLDLLSTDHVHSNHLFVNRGNGTFVNAAAAMGISSPADTFSAAWGDFDGDGRPDVAMVGHFDNVLYRNDGPTGGWISLDLVGTASNRSAIGATVILGGIPGRKPNLTVTGGTGAYGQDASTVTFGVGASPGPFAVRILWPSGTTQTVTGLLPGQRVTVVEP